MTAILPTLLVAITVVGAVHTITRHYHDKAAQPRKREAMARLGFRVWKARDGVLNAGD